MTNGNTSREERIKQREARKSTTSPIKKINWSDLEDIKKIVKKDGLMLKYAPKKFKNNVELIKCAISENIKALEYVSEELKNNDEIFKIIDISNKMEKCKIISIENLLNKS